MSGRDDRGKRLRWSGVSPLRATSLAASFGRGPYVRGGCPATGRSRCPPSRPRCRATRAGPGPHARAECADRRVKVTVTGPERRALSVSAPPHARALEDPFQTLRKTRFAESIFGTHSCARSHCQPGGPEARARPEARSYGNTLNLELHRCKMAACPEQDSRRVTSMAGWRTGSRSGCWRRRFRVSWWRRSLTRPGRGSSAGGCCRRG